MKKLYMIVPLLIVLSSTLLAAPRAIEDRPITFKDVFLTKTVKSQHTIERLNQKANDLGLALRFSKDADGNRIAHLDIRGLDLIIPQWLLEKIYYSLSTNPHHNTTAHVRVFDNGTPVGDEEAAFVAQRLADCHRGLETLLEQQIPFEKTPRIAICGSGGGLRAALSFAGFCDGLNEIEVLDAVTYASGLSGSTWFLTPWMLSPKNLNLFFYEFIERVTHGFVNKPVEERITELKKALPQVAEYLLRRLVFKEVPTVIDIYGYCLALSLLDSNLSAQEYLALDLADQKELLHLNHPFPFGTAVIPQNDAVNYTWVEFSPCEVASPELQYAVPTWAYGRKFKNGSSTNNMPPITQGFLLGLWGSALSISFEEFYNMFLDNLEPKAIFSQLKYLAQSTPIGDTRIFPALLRNPTYKMDGMPHADHKRDTVIDAGFGFNIPVPPLLHPARKVDIIIICDASGNVLHAPELRRAQNWAAAHGLPFPSINYDGITDRTFSVFDDGVDGVPVVIYVPMIKNSNYDANFDPQDHLGKGGFMSSGNFDYNEDQAHLLSGLLRHAIYEAKQAIIDVIKQVVNRKK